MTEYKKELTELARNHPQVWKYRNKVIMAAIIKLLILEAVAVAVPLLLLKDRMQVMVTVMILCGIGFPLLWVKPFRMIRKHYVGHLESIGHVQKRVSVGGAASTLYTSMRDANFIKCTVKDSNGNTHIFEAPATYSAVYKTGDTVLSTSGIYYPINLTPHEQTVCPRCAGITPLNKETCIVCHFVMSNQKGHELC